VRDGIHIAPIAVLWLAWLAYWMIAARGGKPVQREEPVWSRLSYLVPLMVGALLLAFGRAFGGWFSGRFMPHFEVIYWVGTIMVAAGIAFMVWARLHLGGNWSGRVTLKHDHELIRTGPYALVRHPIYSGLLLGLLGTVIVFGQWVVAIAFVLIAAAIWRKSRIEERYLAEIFPDDYARYCADVPALVPSFFRHRAAPTANSERR